MMPIMARRLRPVTSVWSRLAHTTSRACSSVTRATSATDATVGGAPGQAACR